MGNVGSETNIWQIMHAVGQTVDGEGKGRENRELEVS